MAIDFQNTPATQTSALDTQADRLVSRGGSLLSGASASSREDSRITKAGQDFESILLGNWLQQAEQSFAKVPGGDGEEDAEDSGKDQFQGIAMQALARSLTASGGIGIAKMITSALHARQHSTGTAKGAEDHSDTGLNKTP